LTQSQIDMLGSVGIGSLLANLTVNPSTRISPFYLSLVLTMQFKNKWSVLKQ